jgi:hypothetical protein
MPGYKHMTNKDYLPKINNKKGDLSIVVFVFLTLLLCIYTIYVITSNKSRVNESLAGYSISERMLLEQKEFEYRLTKLGEECLPGIFKAEIKTIIDLDGWVEERSSEKLDKYLENCLRIKSKEYIEGLEGENFLNIKRFYEHVDRNKISFSHSDDLIIIELDNFEILANENKYPVSITANIFMSKIGLVHPKEVKEVILCSDELCRNKILRDIFNLNIERIEDSEDEIYKFSSKKEFWIENKFDKIEFNFYVSSEN